MLQTDLYPLHPYLLPLHFKMAFFDSLIFLFYLLSFRSGISVQLIKFWTAKDFFTALAQIFWMCSIAMGYELGQSKGLV